MKKLVLFSVLAVFAVSCSNNNKTDEQENAERTSTDSIQKTKDEMFVDSLERAEEAAMKDSAK